MKPVAKRYGIVGAGIWSLITLGVFGSIFFLGDAPSVVKFGVVFFGILSLLNTVGSFLGLTRVSIGNGQVHFRQGRGIDYSIAFADIKGIVASFQVLENDRGGTYKVYNLVLKTHDGDFMLRQGSLRAICDIAVDLERATGLTTELETNIAGIEEKWQDFHKLFRDRNSI